MVGYGNSVAPLGTAVANYGTEGLRYLRSEESCATILGPARKPRPDYVAYFGPYETLAEPCELRMTPEHRGDFVTVLRSGNEELVKCACALPSTAGPELTTGMVPTAEDVVWIRSLQSMLYDYFDEDFPHDAITGEYDERTAAAVTRVQQEAPGRADPARRRGCDHLADPHRPDLPDLRLLRRTSPRGAEGSPQ